MSEPKPPRIAYDRDATALERFRSGAVRVPIPYRYDLICPVALQQLASIYYEGASKYGEDNWTKGIPRSNLLNHIEAHIQAYRAGDRSELHLSKAVWGLFALIHFDTECTHAGPLRKRTRKPKVKGAKHEDEPHREGS